jgi:uncharacterized Zn-finger protein
MNYQTPTQQPPETITVATKTVGCDGGAGASTGALGHPLVYINLVKDARGQYSGECGYCDRRFVLDPAAADEHGH